MLRPVLFTSLCALVACASDSGGLAPTDASTPGDAGVGSNPSDASPRDARPEGAEDAGARDSGPPPNPLCDFGGQMTQPFGDPCGCSEDCVPASNVCARNFLREPLASSYCTEACDDDDDCPAGFGCWTLPPEPFCERCAATPGSRGIGEDCICDGDCGTVDVNGEAQPLVCRDDRCTRVGCIPVVNRGCPNGYNCELVGLEPRCIECINANPAPRYAACGCQSDCEAGLDCVDGACRQPCADDAACLMDEECEQRLLGPSYCRTVPALCDPAADRPIGAPCFCNAECSAAAPDCLSQTLTSSLSAGFCSIRPCDLQSADPCGDPGFSCCEVPFLFPASCLPSALVSVFEGFATCAP